ncbi:uncharacterized protein LOC131247188 [Magnolia sinica]|uniref:uncharacterized protein LOC131247188 n=1 Tax=Magnolia sinica TaxID=86752 RepID=UPI0026585491|nr:uncharacterized protein LOC131247188 [Magnolia sinica]
MAWSPKSAANAYLDTLKLCKFDYERHHNSFKSAEPATNEFISALAAGMCAQLIVEVSFGVSKMTIALAVAARQTGGRLVCIVPEAQALPELKQSIKDSGLKDIVEFKVGDPLELLLEYKNIDFSLVDCKTHNYSALLQLLDVNPRRSVVVANNLVGGRKGLGGHMSGMMGAVRSMKHPIGKGMEVTMIGKSDEFGKRERKAGVERVRTPRKSNWIVKVDEVSGEEHIFRVPRFI